MSENSTLDYYNKNASSFAETTIDVDFQKTQKRFQKLLPMQGYILDFGCGSGRDTKYFLSQHFQVGAIDGSEELCRIASDYAGIKVKKMLFKELEEIILFLTIISVLSDWLNVSCYAYSITDCIQLNISF